MRCSKCKNDIKTRIADTMKIDGLLFYKCKSCKKYVEGFLT